MITDGGVTTPDIGDAAVVRAKIAANAIVSGLIMDHTVTVDDLADGATLDEILDDDGSGSKLDADLLDGHDSGYFMTAGTDRWVNTSGDTMTGSLEIENSITIGTGSATEDDYLYMDGGNKHLRWDVSAGRFFINDNLYVRNSLQVGWTSTQKAYSVFGTGGTTHSADISGEDDLLVNGDFEVNGKIFVDSGELYIGTGSGSDDDYIFMDAGNERFGWKNDLDDDPGNGENGGFYFSDELELTGDITVSSGDFAYSTPRNKYLNIPALAFIKSELDPNAYWVHSSSGYRYVSSLGTSSFCTASAPIYLPTGATVEQVTIRYGDRSSSENLAVSYTLKAVGQQLSGFPPTPLATVWRLAEGSGTSAGSSSGILAFSTSSIDENNDTISQSKSYFLEINWNSINTSTNTSLRFYGAQITYSIDNL